MLKKGSGELHNRPQSGQDYPTAIEDEIYTREFLVIPGLYDNRMSDEEFENFARSGRSLVFDSYTHPFDAFYSISSDETQTHHGHTVHFLSSHGKSPRSQRVDDIYDYPLGVEDLEFEDDDVHSLDLSEDEMLFDDPEIWMESFDAGEGENDIDVRYFDASDLYDRSDIQDRDIETKMGAPSTPDKSTSENTETSSPSLRDTFGESISGRRKEPSLPVGGILEVAKGNSKLRQSPFANRFFGPRSRARSS